MKNQNFSYETTLAINVALEAGYLLKKGFNTAFEIKFKEGNHNLVTEYDLLSEDFIKQELSAPGYGFYCEESGVSDENSKATWVIDPLDGTVNFAHGIPFFCVSIALVKDEKVELGVIYNPITEELFTSEKTKGSFLNGKKIEVSKTFSLEKSLLATGFPYNVKENPDSCIEQFTRFVKMGLPVRRLGSAALDLAYVACGRFDGFFEVILEPWDFAAGALIVEEALGRVTNYKCNPLCFKKRSPLLASNGLIHTEIAMQLSNN